MRMEFTLTGEEALIAQLEQLAGKAPETAAGSLYRSAQKVMTLSKDQYVPVDTGALRSSGTVEVEIRGNEVEVQLGFGGVASGYAVFVHEINKNYKGGRQWKYLQQPLTESISDINAALVTDFNKMLAGG